MNNIPEQLAPAYMNGKVDAGHLRPYFHNGKVFVSLKTGYDTVIKNGRTFYQPKYQAMEAPQMWHNNLLRKYDWEQIDAAVLRVVHAPNIAMNDFLRLGLSFPLDGVGVVNSVYEQTSGMTEANVVMDGIVPGERDRVAYTPQSIPVPYIIKDFQITTRQLASAARGDGALETTHVEEATISVQNKIDDMIFNGDGTLLGDGNTIAGFTTKTQRMQKTAAQCGGGDFGTAGNAYKTIAGAMNFLRAAGFYGPYGVYVSIEQYAQMMQLVSGTTASELFALTNNLPNVSFINPAHRLADGEVIVWQTTTSVADLAIAQQVAPIQWAVTPFMIDFRVFGVLTVRIKHDGNGNCGVVHITGC